jgi:hypothetical protein
MKHGHKAKGKTAQVKASGKKSSGKTVTKSKAEGKSISAKTSAPKSSGTSAPDNGKNRGRVVIEGISFSNPVVANAFKRAVKKFPTAFRRLTD